LDRKTPKISAETGRGSAGFEDSRILVVEDRMSHRRMLIEFLQEQGFQADPAATLAEAHERFHSTPYHLILLDLRLPEGSGMDLLRTVRQQQPSLPVIVMTAFGTIEDSVQAMKLGAVDFIQKPVQLDQLLLLIRRSIEIDRLRNEVLIYREEFQKHRKLPLLLSRNAGMAEVARQVQRMADTDATILLLGESGTGKELFARTIHLLSPRAAGPFVEVNCAAIPETLMENELFGHVRGAYTGADSAAKGKFELAGGGTLFLDEIGEMPVGIQAKLLKALEEKKITPIGGHFPVGVDVRIVVATNRNLETAMAQERFRKDLFYRVAQFPVRIPPLRERREDVPPLAEYFLREAAVRFGKPPPQLPEEALAALTAYGWPGNVRELKNLVERAVIVDDDGRLSPADLFPGAIAGPGDTVEIDLDDIGRQGLEAWLQARQERLEEAVLRRAREAAGNDRRQAAERLGLTEKALAAKWKRYGLE
jgi:DNA-binding NtrC family response regulator